MASRSFTYCHTYIISYLNFSISYHYTANEKANIYPILVKLVYWKITTTFTGKIDHFFPASSQLQVYDIPLSLNIAVGRAFDVLFSWKFLGIGGGCSDQYVSPYFCLYHRRLQELGILCRF